MPELNPRTSILRVFFSAVILGGVLTISSWVVVQFPNAYATCLSQVSTSGVYCELFTRGRGFPLQWIGEYGMLVNYPEGVFSRFSSLPSQIPTGIYWLIDPAGLAVDLALWIWLSFALILLLTKPVGKTERLASRKRGRIGILIGLASMGLGLMVALFWAGSISLSLCFEITCEYIAYPAQLWLSLFAYFVMVAGLGMVTAGYCRSAAVVWLECLAAGTLIALSSGFVAPLVEVPFPIGGPIPPQYMEQGLPLAWITIEKITTQTTTQFSQTIFSILVWSFVVDVILWSSTVAAFLMLIFELKRRRRLAVSSKIVRNFLLAIFFGGLLTLSSWIVWRGLYCADTLLCAFVTVGRGFPLPWIREFGLPNVSPYHGGIEIQLIPPGLVIDLVAWVWLSFVGLQICSGRVIGNRRGLVSSKLRFGEFLLGLVAIPVGLIVGLVVWPPFGSGDIPNELYALSILGYSVLILGVATLVAVYKRTRPALWLTLLLAGTLIAMATGFVQSPQSWSSGPYQGMPVGDLTKYGLPFSWLASYRPVVLQVEPFLLYLVTDWAFWLDELFWSSVLACLALIASARVRGSNRRDRGESSRR
jgi:hypothetical protein